MSISARQALAVLLITLGITVTLVSPAFQGAPGRSIAPLMAALVLGWVIWATNSRNRYAAWIGRRPVHAAELAVVVLMAAGLVMKEFGLTSLFWHEVPWVQTCVGGAVAALALFLWSLDTPAAVGMTWSPPTCHWGHLLRRPVAYLSQSVHGPAGWQIAARQHLFHLFVPFGVLLFLLALSNTIARMAGGPVAQWTADLWLPLGAWAVALLCHAVLCLLSLPLSRWLPGAAPFAAPAAGLIALGWGASWLIEGGAVCSLVLLLAMVGLLVEVFVRLTRRRGPLLRLAAGTAVVVAIGWINGGENHNLMYPGMEHYYEKGRRVSFPVPDSIRPVPPGQPQEPPAPSSQAGYLDRLSQTIFGVTASDRLLGGGVRGTPSKLDYRIPPEHTNPSAYEDPNLDHKIKSLEESVLRAWQTALVPRAVAAEALAAPSSTSPGFPQAGAALAVASSDVSAAIRRDPHYSDNALALRQALGTRLAKRLQHYSNLHLAIADGRKLVQVAPQLAASHATLSMALSRYVILTIQYIFKDPKTPEIPAYLAPLADEAVAEQARADVIGGEDYRPLKKLCHDDLAKMFALRGMYGVLLKKDVSAAVPDLKRALEYAPQEELFYTLLETHFAFSRDDAAEGKLLDRRVAAMSDSPSAYYARGSYLLRKSTSSSLPRAIADFTTAIRLITDDLPGLRECYQRRAECYERLSRHDNRDTNITYRDADYEYVSRLFELESYTAQHAEDAKRERFPKDLVPDHEALAAWRKEDDGGLAPGTRKPVLVVVATSGGGIAAAYWTALCLDNLDRHCEPFRRRLRLVTGASGGMLGAGVFVARLSGLKEAGPHGPGDSADDVGRDSLTPFARMMFLHDLPSLLYPGRVRDDRGRALEESWADNTAGTVSMPLSKLAGAERAGRLPSLVISPFLIEDGKFLLISNLDLGGLDGHPEFFKNFPGAWETFRLSTAIRMNAAFPYVSPGVPLPCEPPRRVVDAGYLDNYGVRLACAWIERHRTWLWHNTGGVLLVQLRAYPKEAAAVRAGDTSRLRSGWEFLDTPLEGLLAVRSAAMRDYNDVRVEQTRQWFNFDGRKPLFFESVEFECNEVVPLGWYLTTEDRAKMARALKQPLLEGRLERVSQLLRQPEAWRRQGNGSP